MKTVSTLILVGTLCAGVIAWAQADQGKDLYGKKMCTACHGGGKKGPDLKGTKLDKAAIVKYMKDPKAVNPKATMPPVKATDAEAGAIADYVKSMK